MAINIPGKNDKIASQMRDALRILAWQQYKIDNECSGLEAYGAFDEEWKQHEIQDMSFEQLKKLIGDLGYSIGDLQNIRKDYYATRNSKQSDTDLLGEIPF
ncbi:MAG: hypothetical protein ACLFQP_00575 [Halothece sp.]